ncbi:YcxB family protein, partial [Motilimonas sp. 1_MG-2023]|nr:YcxB family protein [Motilimonas sp. 1_MG-2023]
ILLVLVVLETISFIYLRAWWLTIQMWSRSSNSEVTFVFDEQGFSSINPYTETKLLCQDIKKNIDNELGVI